MNTHKKNAPRIFDYMKKAGLLEIFMLVLKKKKWRFPRRRRYVSWESQVRRGDAI